MKTRDIVSNWVDLMVNGNTNFGSLYGSSCRANGYFFVSYDTPIAKFCGDHFELATKKYSTTTSRLQTYLRSSIPATMLCEVDEIIDNGEFPFRR